MGMGFVVCVCLREGISTRFKALQGISNKIALQIFKQGPWLSINIGFVVVLRNVNKRAAFYFPASHFPQSSLMSPSASKTGFYDEK
jgi:hypothetical protein